MSRTDSHQLQAMWKSRVSIEQIAEFIAIREGKNPLVLAKVLHDAFDCGGRSLVRFANSFCDQGVDEDLCKELAKRIDSKNPTNEGTSS